MNPTKYDEAEYITCCKSDYEKLLADKAKLQAENQVFSEQSCIHNQQMIMAKEQIHKLQADVKQFQDFFNNGVCPHCIQKDKEIDRLKELVADLKAELGQMDDFRD
jgi:cell division protein FtsB